MAISIFLIFNRTVFHFCQSRVMIKLLHSADLCYHKIFNQNPSTDHAPSGQSERVQRFDHLRQRNSGLDGRAGPQDGPLLLGSQRGSHPRDRRLQNTQPVWSRKSTEEVSRFRCEVLRRHSTRRQGVSS
jgi:hypothetical protein